MLIITKIFRRNHKIKKGLLLVAVLLFGAAGCSSKDDRKKEGNVDTPIKEETEMAVSMIGAKNGVKYKTDKGSLEFYEFNKTSDVYKKAESDRIITLEGFGDFEIAVNNGFAMMKTAYNEEAVKLFQAL